jgi:hypothetical protein
MVIVKKGFEDAEVTYEDAGQVFHVKLADASQEVLKKLKGLGVEAVEEKKAADK